MHTKSAAHLQQQAVTACGQSNLRNDMPVRRAIIMSWRFYKRIIGIVFYNNNNNNYVRVINAYAKETQ